MTGNKDYHQDHDSLFVRFEHLKNALDEVAIHTAPIQRKARLHLDAATELVRLIRGQVLR